MGSTEEARRAGIRHATAAATTIKRGAPGIRRKLWVLFSTQRGNY